MAVTKHNYHKIHDEVRETYQNHTRAEFHRLTKQHNLKSYLEFYTTMHYLRKYLPKGGTILDAGSGPGRYSLELARMGYHVVALDAAENSIRFLEQRARRLGLSDKVQKTVIGRIEDLSIFDDNQFDAVLCLGGPLSHIMEKRLRQNAARELLRVAKTGAPVFVSVMSLLATVKGFLKLFQNEVTAPYVKSFMEDGDYVWPHLYGFTHFHGFKPEELSATFAGRHFKQLALVSLEGYGSYETEDLKRLHRNKRRWNAWLRLHVAVSAEPSIVGASEHMLLIGRKT